MSAKAYNPLLIAPWEPDIRRVLNKNFLQVICVVAYVMIEGLLYF